VRCKCGKLFRGRPPKALPAERSLSRTVFAVDEDSDVSFIPSKRKMPTVMRSPAAGASATIPCRSRHRRRPDLAAAYPTHGRRRIAHPQVQDDDDGSSKKKQLVIIAAILVLLVGGGIFARLAMKGGIVGSSKPMLGDDAMITGMIKDENGTEVKEWLKANSRHMFFSMTEGQANALADRLYAMGADQGVRLRRGDQPLDRRRVARRPVKRKALFDYEKQHNGFRSKTKDVGQRYFLLWM
jgi:hypothetical protein